MAQLIVDVSEHDGDIDWEKVRDAGYHAIIRAGFGVFASGGRYDRKWEHNACECERLGIPYGVYWYSYATSPESARREARQTLDAIAGHTPSYPLYFDTEDPSTAGCDIKAHAAGFADEIEAAGYWAGVYASESWWAEKLAGFDRCTKWVARWSDSEPATAGCDLWQFQGDDSANTALRGAVPGIGWADVNLLMRETLLEEVGRWGAKEAPATEVCPTCGQPVPDSPVADPAPEVPAEEVAEQEPLPGRTLLTYNQRAAEVMRHMCAHDGDGGHGYSQRQRWGDGTSEAVELSDGTVAAVGNGDYDCSSAVISAWEAVLPGSTADATYTGNMREEFLRTGLWEWHPMGDGYIAQAGDIYLNEVHHTAMCISAEPDLMAQFSISELGTVYGRQGDQTGWESNVKAYANYGNGGWDGKLVYVGPQPDGVGEAQPRATGGVTVDGYWGRETTAALQAALGTPVDGEVWHQWGPNVAANPGLTGGWACDATAKGSAVIRALQARLGVTADGILGPQTVCALQEAMDAAVTGTIGAPSACVGEMQRRLNAGTF